MAEEQYNNAPVMKPPNYCEYAGGVCDQDFISPQLLGGLFLYPSEPTIIASTIEESVNQIKLKIPEQRLFTWRDLDVSGRIIFCKICIASRFSKHIIADVTTLNFNLLFEIGYAIGLGKPVIPIRDTSYIKDQKDFDELGLFFRYAWLSGFPKFYRPK